MTALSGPNGEPAATLTGRFAGPVVGSAVPDTDLRGASPTRKAGSSTGKSEVVVFSVGDVVLGAARGAPRITVADIVARVRREHRQARRPGPDQHRALPADARAGTPSRTVESS